MAYKYGDFTFTFEIGLKNIPSFSIKENQNLDKNNMYYFGTFHTIYRKSNQLLFKFGFILAIIVMYVFN